MTNLEIKLLERTLERQNIIDLAKLLDHFIKYNFEYILEDLNKEEIIDNIINVLNMTQEELNNLIAE